VSNYLAAAATALAPVTAAHAQAVGGDGGGTILNSAVTYFQNNIAADLAPILFTL